MPFKAGDPKPLNSGRKSAVSNHVTRDIREMIRASLDDKAGGVAYLVRQADALCCSMIWDPIIVTVFVIGSMALLVFYTKALGSLARRALTDRP